MFLAMKNAEFTANVAELNVPIGWPLDPSVSAVSPHCTTVLSAPAPCMVTNALIADTLTFSLHHKMKTKFHITKQRHYMQMCQYVWEFDFLLHYPKHQVIELWFKINNIYTISFDLRICSGIDLDHNSN